MKVADPKINQECQRCLVPMHQAQVRVGQLNITMCLLKLLCFCLSEPDKLQYGDVILNVDAVRVVVVKNHCPKHVHVKFKVMQLIPL